MSSLTCTQCGFVLSTGDVSCRRCGARLPSNAQSGGAPENERPVPPPSDPSVPAYGLPRTSRGPAGYGASLAQNAGVWRDGNTLVMDKRATLPDYCVKCGIPANGSRLRKRLSWHHPALALLILVGVLIYVIVALIVRKSAVVEISLCEDHLRRHRTAAIVTWLVFLVGMGFIVLAIAKESGGSALFGIFLVFVSAILAMTWAKVVNVKKIDDYYVWLRGINESFLVMLPSLNK